MWSSLFVPWRGAKEDHIVKVSGCLECRGKVGGTTRLLGPWKKSWWSMVPSFPRELGTEFVVWKPPKFCIFPWCELPHGLFAKGCINSKAWFDSTWSRKKRVKRKHDTVIWWVQWVYQHLTTWWFVLLSLLFSEYPFLEALFTSWERCNSWAKVSVVSCVLAAADSLDSIFKRDTPRVTQVWTHVNCIAFGHDACQWATQLLFSMFTVTL